MAKQIWKFPLDVTDEQAVRMPTGARVLTVQTQSNEWGTHPCLWALVDPAAAVEPRRFYIVGTGHPVPEGARDYVGTFQLHDGALVFHVFEP